ADIAGGGPNTLTATFATPITARAVLYVHEYRGIDRTSPLDAAVTASGYSVTMDSGVLTTTRANDLLFAGGESNGTAVKQVTPGYKARARRYGNVTADRIALVPGAYNITATQIGTAWTMQFFAFKPAGSTPPPPPPNTDYPLKVSANGRYLVDQSNRPFLIT